LLVYKVDAARGLIYLKGHVPGHAGNWVEVRDALRKGLPQEAPFPTHVESAHGEVASLAVTVAPKGEVNPFEIISPQRGVKKKAA
jgi:large subunit ribosomal protein L3